MAKDHLCVFFQNMLEWMNLSKKLQKVQFLFTNNCRLKLVHIDLSLIETEQNLVKIDWQVRPYCLWKNMFLECKVHRHLFEMCYNTYISYICDYIGMNKLKKIKIKNKKSLWV